MSPQLECFQNIFMKEMETMKNFTRMTEGKLDNLENAFVSLFMKNHPSWRDGSKLVIELLKNKGLALEKQLIGKRGLHKYSVKIEVDVT